MLSPTGLIPEELMFREKRMDVVRFIQAQAWPGDFKRNVFRGWCLTVGVRAPARDFRAVERSGVDEISNQTSFPISK
jgi:hypothetical protein